MGVPEIAGWYSDRVLEPIEMNEESITEQAYMPALAQIEGLLAAGRRLDDFRREMWDFESEDKIDWDFQDPTRNPGFDPADGSQMAIQVAKRMKARMNAEKAEKDAAIAAQEAKDAAEKAAYEQWKASRPTGPE